MNAPVSLTDPSLSKKQVEKIIKKQIHVPLHSSSSSSSSFSENEALNPEWVQNRVVILYNFLSHEECQYFIQEAQKLGLQDAGYDHRYRECDRVSIDSPQIAECFYDRVRSFAPQFCREIRDEKAGAGGVWKIHSLNEVFRIVRYFPGGHFSPHYDAMFPRTRTNRSLKTFMIYLTGNYEGGFTNFVDGNGGYQLSNSFAYGRQESEKWHAPEGSIIERIKPEEGMLLLFDHNMLHEGTRLLSGEKWIMRSEIMYEFDANDFLRKKILFSTQETETKQNEEL